MDTLCSGHGSSVPTFSTLEQEKQMLLVETERATDYKLVIMVVNQKNRTTKTKPSN